MWDLVHFSIYLTIIFQKECFAAILFPNINNASASLRAECSLQIIREHFEDELTIVAQYNNSRVSSEMLTEELVILNEMYISANTSVQLRSNNTRTKRNNKIKAPDVSATAYLLFLGNESDVVDVFSWIVRDRTWNPYAKFIIRVDNFNSTDSDNIIWQTIVKHLVMNVVIVNHNTYNSSIEVSTYIHIYIYIYCVEFLILQYSTWYSYPKWNCSLREMNVGLLGNCFNGHIGYSEGSYTMFPLKVPYNFRGCNIYVGVIIWPPNIIAENLEQVNKREEEVVDLYGIEVELLKLIAGELNFTPKFYCYGIEDNWGHVYSRDISTGLFKALSQNEVDVIMGTITSTIKRFKYLDVSNQYLLVSNPYIAVNTDDYGG